MKSFDYELEDSIAYKHQSRDAESNLIVLKKPNGKTSETCARIKGLINAGIIRISKDLNVEASGSAKEKEEIMSREEALDLMHCCGEDYARIVSAFKDLLKYRGFIGGEKGLSQMMIDEDLDESDIENMLGDYYRFFLKR